MADSPDGERLVGADRVLAVLVDLAEHPAGVTLDELAGRLSSPRSTVHRALASLRRARLATQTGRGRYMLGDDFIRLALKNQAGRPDTERIEPVLAKLVERFGETAHFALLEGRDVVYRAKVDPSQGAVRLSSTVGGRNPAYRTAVGKLLLSQILPDRDAFDSWLPEEPLEAPTAHTITDPDALWRELVTTRERGYATDDQENELGVNCVAVPVGSTAVRAAEGAVSVSALAFRTPLRRLVEAVPEILAITATLRSP
jgi:IclR family acetate operon transcriptional repressor